MKMHNLLSNHLEGILMRITSGFQILNHPLMVVTCCLQSLDLIFEVINYCVIVLALGWRCNEHISRYNSQLMHMEMAPHSHPPWIHQGALVGEELHLP